VECLHTCQPLRFWHNFYILKLKLCHYDHYCNITLFIVHYWMHTKRNLWTPSLTNCWYFETKSLHNHSRQRPSVKLQMHQNKSWLGLCPRRHWGSLQRSSRSPSCPLSSVITLSGFQMLAMPTSGNQLGMYMCVFCVCCMCWSFWFAHNCNVG